ncbi:response regulator [Hymenobacter ginsengisoli]|uniref:Response regulator n=1 Tax=Hymenobacter ginsengisoli TaxID=1051626 RepID=A0ABP8Q789_9BACT|nr:MULTISPECIES: response regulator [unclassified Hymenobacter]MBO2030807.1 response regulator [Hymenobacter sp. BT559]
MKTYLIDDDHLAIFLARHLLQSEGFSNTICAFQSAEEALAELLTHEREGLPRVIFLDLNMPVMNGWQFLEALTPHADELRGHCHIYILTSSLALADLEKSKHYQLVDGLIHKPLDRSELRAIRARLEPGAGAS